MKLRKNEVFHYEGMNTVHFHIKFVEAMLLFISTDKSMFMRPNEMLNEG